MDSYVSSYWSCRILPAVIISTFDPTSIFEVYQSDIIIDKCDLPIPTGMLRRKNLVSGFSVLVLTMKLRASVCS
jgi:hypothetical protein